MRVQEVALAGAINAREDAKVTKKAKATLIFMT
jgi:hypothetical protein